MTAINRKLCRDLSHLKGQSLAIALVMACGVAAFVNASSTASSLQSALDTYYDRYRFADVFAHLKRAPNSVAGRITDIPGVSRVETRVVIDVSLDVPGLVEPAIGRLVSVPDLPTPGLNQVYLREGRYVESGRRGEVLVHEAFALAHALKPGDTLAAIINGRRERLTVVGIALSPEYVYAIRPGEVFPDDRRFGVFWMAYSELAPAYDLDGAFNGVALSLAPGTRESEVISRLDEITEQYGGVGRTAATTSSSHKLIDGELSQLRGMALIPPSIFLSVAAFLLNVVMSRLIGLQREQIAVLKAFGYARWEIGWHYLKFVLVLAALGSAIGVIGGAYIGRMFTEMYGQFFRLPAYEYRLELLGGGHGSPAHRRRPRRLGTLTAVRRAVVLPAAEAMRPEPPPSTAGLWAERIGLASLLSPAGRMILRRIGRQPVRAALTVFGIALSCAILVMGSFVEDTIDYMIEFQFFRVQRYDVSLGFVEPSGAARRPRRCPPAGRDARRAVPGRPRACPLRRRAIAASASPASCRTRSFSARSMRPAVRSWSRRRDSSSRTELADVLGARIGDVVTVEVLEGERPVVGVPIAGVVEDFSGLVAYMDIGAVRRMLREGDTASGVFLAVDPSRQAELYTELKETPRVGSVAIKSAALRGFEKTMAENLLVMRALNLMFATVIAFGVVYNTARIALAERSRELATLRVMGFTRAEVSFLLLGEMAVLTLLALPLGMVMGYGMAAFAVVALETETQSFPLVIEPSTYSFAAVVVMVAATITGLIVRRRVDRLDLVEVLKSRE